MTASSVITRDQECLQVCPEEGTEDSTEPRSGARSLPAGMRQGREELPDTQSAKKELRVHALEWRAHMGRHMLHRQNNGPSDVCCHVWKPVKATVPSDRDSADVIKVTALEKGR